MRRSGGGSKAGEPAGGEKVAGESPGRRTAGAAAGWALRRTELRRGYRYRSLLTELGLVEFLRVPRERQRCYQPTVLTRYQRRQARVNQLIREVFLAGVSTHRVGEVLTPVLGEAPSSQTVSRVARSLDAEVCRFHT